MKYDLTEKRILIVDDTKENIDVLGEILSDYKRNVALNGMRALKIAKEKQPDLILLDIMMPEMDGFEVCEKLKSDPETADIPVIFITAKNQVEDEVKGLELGAIDFISKPISPPIVEARVRTHLELKISKDEVEIKNKDLESTLIELKTAQNQLVHSEKMAALGHLVSGIAHEINTPLGAINSSNRSILSEMPNLLNVIPSICKVVNSDHKDTYLQLVNKAFEKSLIITSREERKFRRALTAELEERGVAHADVIAESFVELGIYSDVDKYLPILYSENSSDILTATQKLTGIKFSSDIIMTAVDKVAKIVYSLKNFARFDSEGKKVTVDIHQNIDTILTLYNSQLKQGVEIIKEYSLSRALFVVPDQMHQVWTNTIHNAIHAMNNNGTITIKTQEVGDEALISITDTGKGMSNEIISKIFNPFFTTKPEGEGTGLGLDIVNKIIKNHDGRIEVESEEGVGTTFNFYLPIIKEG